ncbi:MAG TPA: HPr family phosphocarrier protein [Rhizobiaceae bacterium]|nr:HPr family phosphocarrier protein [Rhizobiaceae bacterium]
MTVETAQTEIVITHQVGLHARPSVKFTKLAKNFECAIEVAIAPQGPWIDAKGIVKIMALKAPVGTRLQIRASGVDAAKAVEALRALVERDFDEGESHAQAAQA